MNGDQLHEWITMLGVGDDAYGDLLVTVDCWTASVFAAVLRPAKNNQDTHRTVTVVVSACQADLMANKPFAGFVPTIVGDALDDWKSLCDKAITQTYLTAVNYQLNLYNEIGFDQEKFLLETVPALGMSHDQANAHLDARLNYAATKRHLNLKLASYMDMELSDDQRKQLLQAIELQDKMMDMAGQMLSEVDGQ